MSSPSEPFSQARSLVWEKLSDKEKKTFSGILTIQDVWKATTDIQAQQAKNRTLGNMNKIRPYLEGLQRYSEVIGIFVQAKPEILSFIWGPIRFVLQIASNYFRGYDKLLDVFHEIGLSLPQFKEYGEIFHGSDQMLADYLALFYKEIIEFHFQLLRFYRMTRWKALFDVLWPRYEDTFTLIHKNIEKHKLLIDRQVNILVIKDAQKEREEALSRHHEERDFREMTRLEKNIPHHTRDYVDRLHDIRDKYCAETGKWILSDPRFQSWVDANSSDAKQRLLWLSGIPGAGKTFLSFSILQHLQVQMEAVEGACLIYAFPTYDNGNTKPAIVESMIYQLCRANTALIPAANREYDSHFSRGRIFDLWDKLLEDFICRAEPVYMILDGLDECAENHRKNLLDIIVKLCNDCRNLRVVVSSRKEVDIRQKLETNAEMVAVEDRNRSDIEKFVKQEINDLWERIKGITAPETEDIFKTLARNIACRSEGMFLYARLVLENLQSQPTVPHILDEANSLPKNLHEIYGRMLNRIVTLLSPSEQAEVKKIFSWLICARRPLRTIELEHAILIHPGDKELQYTRRLVKDILELCGPIIEKRNDYLTFVHFSAKEYLINKQQSDYICRVKSHSEVAATCLSYLSFRYYDHDITDNEVDTFILDGGYVLHEYAQANFLHHIRGAWKDQIATADGLVELIQQFLEARWNPSFKTLDQELAPETPSLHHMQSIYPNEYKKLNLIAAFSRNQRYLQDDQDDDINPLLGAVSRRIYQRFDTLASARCTGNRHVHCSSMHRFYGGELFRCPVTTCSRSWYGFETFSKRDEHTTKHQRPFKCGVVNCDFNKIGFETAANKNEHVSACHSSSHELNADWNDLDGLACNRLLCSAAKASDIGLIQSLLSLSSGKGYNVDFPRLLDATGAEGSVDLVELVVSHWNLDRIDGKALIKSLHHAILSAREATIRALLRKRPLKDLDDRSKIKMRWKDGMLPTGLTSLYLAVIVQSQSVVNILLEAGANVNTAVSPVHNGSWATTPLHLAVENSLESIAESLLREGANSEVIDNKHRTPLSIAVDNANQDMVQILLEGGARADGHSLCKAAANGHLEIAQFLSENGATVDDKDFHAAVVAGDTTLVQTLLDLGAQTDVKDFSGRSAPHCATEAGHITTTRLLLDNGAHLEVRDSLFRTLLHSAAENGHDEFVQLFLDKGAYIEEQNKSGETALLFAVTAGHEATVKLLLDRGAQIESKDHFGNTALHRAVQKQQLRIAQLLIEKGADIESVDSSELVTPLVSAARRGHEQIVKLLLSSGAQIESKDRSGCTALRRAVDRGYLLVAQLLIKHGADMASVDFSNHQLTPLLSAASKGHQQIVELLLNRGVQIESKDKSGCTALRRAADEGRLLVAQLLIKHGADMVSVDFSDHQLTPLLSAASKGYEQIVELLLNRGVQIESKDKSGCTALRRVVDRGYLQIAQLLIEKGADIESVDSSELETPLMSTARRGHGQMVKLLLSSGAQIESKDRSGCTALRRAVDRGSLQIAQLLIEKGADIESVNSSELVTPLLSAARRGYEQIVKLLCDKGAQIEAKDCFGSTALCYAAEAGDLTIVNFLLDRGADVMSLDPSGRYRPEVEDLLYERGGLLFG